MSSHPIRTLYTSVKNALNAIDGHEAFAEFAPIGAERPYIVFFLASGSDTRTNPKNRQMMTLTVKCVANTLSEALTGASALDGILANGGLFNRGGIVGDGDWAICTIIRNGTVNLVEFDEQVKPIYHSGYSYEIVMEVMED